MLAGNQDDSREFERDLERIRQEMDRRLRDTALRMRIRVLKTLLKYADETAPSQADQPKPEDGLDSKSL